MSHFEKIFDCSKAKNKDELYKEWDFIKRIKQKKGNTVPCICGINIFAEINIYKNNKKKNTCIFVGSKCSKKLQLNNKIKKKYDTIDRLSSGMKYPNTYTKIKDINTYLKYVYEYIYNLLNKKLNENKKSLKELKELKIDIDDIFSNNKEYINIITNVNQYIKQEKTRQREKSEKKKMQNEEIRTRRYNTYIKNKKACIIQSIIRMYNIKKMNIIQYVGIFKMKKFLKKYIYKINQDKKTRQRKKNKKKLCYKNNKIFQVYQEIIITNKNSNDCANNLYKLLKDYYPNDTSKDDLYYTISNKINELYSSNCN